jgi:hypothetical protein
MDRLSILHLSGSSAKQLVRFTHFMEFLLSQSLESLSLPPSSTLMCALKAVRDVLLEVSGCFLLDFFSPLCL